MPNSEQKQNLYKNLTRDGYNLGSYDEFSSKMQDETSRSNLYKNLSKDGYKLGTLEDFSKVVYNPSTNRAATTSQVAQKAEKAESQSTTVIPQAASQVKTPSATTTASTTQSVAKPAQPATTKSIAKPSKPAQVNQVLLGAAMGGVKSDTAAKVATVLPDAKKERKQIDKVFDKVIAEQDKKFGATFKRQAKMQSTANSYVEAMTGTPDYTMPLHEANKEVTPSKIISIIQDKIMNGNGNKGKGSGKGKTDPSVEAASKIQAQRIYDYVKDKLIQREIPQNQWEAFFKTILANNSVANLINYATKTPEQLQYTQQAMQDNRAAKLGTTANVAATVAGMALDPITYISAGVGNTVANKVMSWGIGKGLQSWGTNQALRYMTMRGGLNLILSRIAGGAANFATFEGLGNISAQLGSGNDFDWSQVATSIAKGATMGLFMSGFSNMLGKWTPNTFVGKAGKYGTDLTGRSLIFAGGDLAYKAVTDENFDLAKEDLAGDLINAYATNIGFDIYHAVGKVASAGKATANYMDARYKADRGRAIKLYAKDSGVAESDVRRIIDTPDNKLNHQEQLLKKSYKDHESRIPNEQKSERGGNVKRPNKAQVFLAYLDNEYKNHTFDMDDVRAAQRCGLNIKNVDELITQLSEIAEEDAKYSQQYNTDESGADLEKLMNTSQLGAFLQHENMTETLRNKIVGAITGDYKTPSITGVGQVEQTQNGYTVTTTSIAGIDNVRRFNSRQDAEKYRARQLNKSRTGRLRYMLSQFALGYNAEREQYKKERFAYFYKTTPENVDAILRKAMEGEALSEGDEELVRSYLSTEIPKGFTSGYDLREFNQEFKDAWHLSDEEFNRLINSDYESLDSKKKNIYRNYLQNVSERLTELHNRKNVAEEAPTEGVAEEGTASTEETAVIPEATEESGESNNQIMFDVPLEDGTTDTILSASNESTGMSMANALEAGARAENHEMIKTYLGQVGSRLDPTKKKLIDAAFANDTVDEMLRDLNGRLTQDDIGYISLKQQQKGYVNKVVKTEGDMAAQAVRDKYSAYVDDKGNIRTAIIDGKEVILTGNEGDEFCYYIDEEGITKMVEWSKVSDIQEHSYRDLQASARQQAEENALTQVTHQFEHEPSTHMEYKVGDTFNAYDKDGNKRMYGVMNVDESGNVTYGEITSADGKVKNPQVKTVAELQKMEDDAQRGITPETEESATPEATTPETPEAETPTEGNNPEATTEPTETTPSEEPATPATALEQIPVDNRGKRQWTQAEPSTTLDAMTERAKGNSELVEKVVDAQIERANKALEKAQKKDVKSGDVDSMLDESDKNSAEIEAAKKELEYWQSVKAELERRKSADETNDIMDDMLGKEGEETSKAETTEETATEETAESAPEAEEPETPKQKTEEEYNSEIEDKKQQLRDLLGITDDRDVTQQEINTRTSRESKKRKQANELLEEIKNLEEERDTTPEVTERKAAEEKAKAEDEEREAEEARLEQERLEEKKRVEEEERRDYEERKAAYEEFMKGSTLQAYEDYMSQMHGPFIETLQQETKKYGMQAIVITNSDNVPEEYQGINFASGRYNAFYDNKRNQFVVYAPNVMSHDHARSLVFHEMAAHKGIPAMFRAMGKDPKEALTAIFNTLTRGTRERWMNYSLDSITTKQLANVIAIANFDKTLDQLQHVNVERDADGNIISAERSGQAGKLFAQCMKQAESVRNLDDLDNNEKAELYKQFGHIAADEYLAHFAEYNGINASTWDKIKAMVREAARSFGIVRDYSESDIRTMLSKASANLIANRENPEYTQPKQVDTPQQQAYLDSDGNVHITDKGKIEAVDDEIKFSLKYKDVIEEASRKKNDKDKKVDDQTLIKAFHDVDEMAKIMTPYGNLLPEDKLGGKNVLPNGSYGKTIENTTICVRTLAYNAFCDAVQEKIGRPLTQMESFLVSQKLYDIAVDPQCLYCYVSLDRKAYNEYLNKYIDERDNAINQWKEAGKPKAGTKKYEELYDAFLNGRRPTKPMAKRFKMFIDNADSKDILTKADLATEARRVEASKGTKAAQLRDALKYAQGASWAKKQIEYTAYSGDILRLSDKWVKDLNSEYGLRFYSFSDYTGAFILENMQQMIDASIRGFKGLAYTKDTNFAKIFAPTGVNINISVYAKKDGKGGYYIDDRQSADIDEAIKLREQYPNVGIVCVATDDEGVKWACRQKWSDVVIPFHIVKTGTNVQEFYKWTQYTNEQNDVMKDSGKKAQQISPVEHLNNYDTYMQLCEERGITPRFERFRTEGDLKPEEYMKMVNETRQSADNTPLLQPKFDMVAAKNAFAEFRDKGGYFDGWYNEGVDVNKEVETVANDVLAGKKANEVPYGRQDLVNPEAIIKNRKKLERKHREAEERARRIAAGEDLRTSKREDEDEIYSDAVKAVDKVDSKRLTSDQWIRAFNSADISDEEREMLGDWMKYRRGMTTKEEVLDHIADARQTKIIVDASPEEREGDVRFSKVEDKETIDAFNKSKKIYAFRKMQLIDGELYPPMAAKVGKDMVNGIKVGDIEMTDERPDLAFYMTVGEKYRNAKGKLKTRGKKKVKPNGSRIIQDENGDYYFGTIDPKNKLKVDDATGELAAFFTLKKGTKGADGEPLTDVDARYNSYFHSSNSMCNDQFSSAYNRPNLVTVKVELSEDDLNSGYRGQYCKDAVGTIDWKSGLMSQKLKEAGKTQRKVNLSRYDKIVRILSAKEVAEFYAKELEGTGIEVPFNTVEPALRDELVKLGVKIGEPEDSNSGKAARPAYEKWLAENGNNNPDGGLRMSKKEESDYEDAFANKDEKKGEEIIRDAFKKSAENPALDSKGNVLDLYHGTSRFGWTKYDISKDDDMIFTSTDRTVSANYAGRENYARVRNINKEYNKDPEIASTQNNEGLRFSRVEDDNDIIERDKAGRPIMPTVSRAEMLTPEGRAKYQAWSVAANEWDKEHPFDVKNRVKAASTVEKLIKSALDDADVDEVTKGKLVAAMKAIKNTKTVNLAGQTSKGFRIAASAITQAYEKQIKDLMSLKIRDKNGRGNAIGKKIDANTAQTFEFLRSFYDKQKGKFIFDSAVLDARINDIEDAMSKRIDSGAKDDAEAWKEQNEANALEILKRVSENNVIGSKLQELIDNGKTIQGKIDELNKKRRESGYAQYYTADDGTTHTFKDDINELKNQLEANELDINAQMQAKMDAEDVIRTRLADMIEGGRDFKKSKAETEHERRRNLVVNFLEAIESDKRYTQQDIDSGRYESSKNPIRNMWDATMDSFEYMCKTFPTNGFGGENWVYDYFIKGKDGVMQASNNYESAMRKHTETLDAKCKELFGKRYMQVVEDANKLDKHSGVYVNVMEDSNNTLGQQGGKMELELTKGQATYLYMLWRMNDGNAQMLRQGFTEESMEQIARFIGEPYADFADFMQMEYLPELRKKYNDRYIEVFDISMAHIENYVPLRRSKMKIAGKDDFTATSNGNPQTITKGANALIERTHNTNNIDCTADAFKVLFDHLNEMEEWYAFARVRQDMQYIFNSAAVKNRLNRNKIGSFKLFADAAKAAAHVRPANDIAMADRAWAELSKSFTTGAIAFRFGTALKQTLSFPAFLDYSADPRYLAIFAKNLAGEYTGNAAGFVKGAAQSVGTAAIQGATLGHAGNWRPTEMFEERANSDATFKAGLTRNFAWCLNNIPDFYERVMNQTTADPIMNDKAAWERSGKMTEDFFYYMSKTRNRVGELGFAANKIVDAVTCAIGAKSIYDYRYARLMEEAAKKYEEGTPEYENAKQEAHRMAVMDATIAFNSSQQSSHAAFLSPLQRERSFASKALTMFKNSPISYSRKLAGYCQDLARAAANAKNGKMTAYYTKRIMMQNPNMSEADARNEANKHIAIGSAKAVWGITLYGFILPWMWAQGGKAVLGLFQRDKDEDKMTEEEKKEQRWADISEKVGYVLDGVPVAQIAYDIPRMWMGISNDWSINSGNAGLNMLKDAVQEGARIYDSNGGVSPQLGCYVASKAVKMGIGFDVDTWSNIAIGLTRLAKDGYISGKSLISGEEYPTTKDQVLVDVSFLLNLPRSQRIETSKKYFDDLHKKLGDEKFYALVSSKDYQDAVKLASNNYTETLPYLSWLPNNEAFNVKKQKALEDEYLAYGQKAGSAQMRKDDKEVVKENNQDAKDETGAKLFRNYVLNHGKGVDYNKYSDKLSKYGVAQSYYERYKRLLQDGRDDDADRLMEQHQDMFDYYQDNAGKIRQVNNLMGRLGQEGEDDNDTYEELIEVLNEE